MTKVLNMPNKFVLRLIRLMSDIRKMYLDGTKYSVKRTMNQSQNLHEINEVKKLNVNLHAYQQPDTHRNLKLCRLFNKTKAYEEIKQSKINKKIAIEHNRIEVHQECKTRFALL